MQQPGDWRLKRYRGRWYAVRAGPAGTERRALRTADREQAAAAFRDFLDALSRPASPHVADLYAAYLAEKPSPRGAHAWKRLGPTFGPLRPEAITRQACRAYSAAREAAGARAGTIRTELIYLRAALRYADRASPARIALPPRPAPRARHLTRLEYIRLRAAARPTPHLYLFIVLALSTGARREAILDLRWSQIDSTRGLVDFGAGTRHKRRAVVPLGRRACAVLRRARRAATSEYVIEWAGGRVAGLRTAWARACARAGLGRDVTPHVLRHTAGVWMAEDDVPMSVIAQVLGHTSTEVTESVYARYSPTYLRRATRALG
jgi:integrase